MDVRQNKIGIFFIPGYLLIFKMQIVNIEKDTVLYGFTKINMKSPLFQVASY